MTSPSGTTPSGSSPPGSSAGDVQPATALPPAEVSDTVTPGMRIAAAWSWRFLVCVAALGLILYAVGYLSELTIPITIALLLCALLNPLRRLLVDRGWKNVWATVLVFVGGLVLVGSVIAVVVQQFVAGASGLVEQVSTGLDKVQTWLITGPLRLSQSQIDSAITSAKKAVVDNRQTLTSGALSTATSVGHLVTGLVLVLFILLFFLRDGAKIWTWMVDLTPRRARTRIHGAGLRAWTTLSGYVRATVLVAFVDAIGIGAGLFILRVPLALPLTAFVFLSSFIPIIGALLSGIICVLVALVAGGLVKALIVLAVVIAVQQLESHVLQPILLGRAVSLHPLAVALSLAAGVIIAGIVGALLAVPIAACLNAAGKYLAGRDPSPGTDEDKVDRHLDHDLAKKPDPAQVARAGTTRTAQRDPG